MSIELDNVASGYNLSVINSNFQKVEDTLNSDIMWRTGNFPGETLMERDLDMNSNNILNAYVGDIPLSEIAEQTQNVTMALKDGGYGYKTVDSFQIGATISYWNEVLRWSLPDGNGEFYRWDGPLPKVVPAGSTPTSAGGIGVGAWISVGDASLRTLLASYNSSSAMPAFSSVAGIFGAVPTINEVRIPLLRYHLDGPNGGGVLVWDNTVARTAHNGFTVFSPDRSYPADWTNSSQRAAWYASTVNATLGVWKRLEKADDLTVDYAGAKPYNPAQVDTESFNALIAAIGTMSDIKLGAGTYRCNIKPRAGMRGLGYSTIMVPAVQATAIVTLEYIDTAFAANWAWKVIRDINFSSESTDGSVGYNISYTTDTGVLNYPNAGRYYFKNLILSNAFAGIRKPYGNIGNMYEGLSTQNVSYGVWARAKSDAPVMHEGNDTFIRCHFNKCFKAGYRADVNVYGSSLDTQFIGCIFEYNDGFGILLRGASTNQLNVGTLRVIGGHFEGNGTVGSTVDIEGVLLQPVDIFSQNIRYINISDVLISSCTLINSSITAHRCQFSDVRGASYYYFSIDAASQIDSYDDGSQFGRPLVGLIVHSVAVPNFNSRNGFLAEHRKARASVSIATPNGFNRTFDGSTPIPSASNPGTIISTQVGDSMLGLFSARWTIPASTTVVLTNPDSMVMPAGRFYVWSFAARWISGSATLQVAQAGGATLSQALIPGNDSYWKTFAGVGLHTTSGDNRVALRVNGDSASSTVVQTADFQVMTFTSLSEALNWMNSGQCLGR